MIDKFKEVLGSMFGGGSGATLAQILELKQKVLNARSAEKSVYDELFAKLRTKRDQHDSASASERDFIQAEMSRLLVRVKRQKGIIETLDRRIYELEEIEHGIRTVDVHKKTTVDTDLVDAINTDIRVAREESAGLSTAVGDLSKETSVALDSTPGVPSASLSEIDALLDRPASATAPASAAGEAAALSPQIQAELDALLGVAKPAPDARPPVSGDRA